MNKLIGLLFSFNCLIIFNVNATIKVCWKATGQCVIVVGEQSCNGYGFGGQASCEVVTQKTSLLPDAPPIQCYKTASCKAYLVYNGIATEIASDAFIKDAQKGTIDPTWKKYESLCSSQAAIDQICREFNIKLTSKETTQTITK